MCRAAIIVTWLFIGATFVICTQTPTYAQGSKKLESHFSAGIGWERLKYKERASDMGIVSNAHVNNVIVDMEGLKRWEVLFTGIKVIAPALKEDGKEKWATQPNKTLQINRLEYGWTRLDGYVGYPLADFINPYGGVRWSETKQERKNVVVPSFPAADSAIERVNSLSFLLGVRGVGNVTSRFQWQYWVEYFYPIYLDVSNSAFPDFETSDNHGYTLDMRGGLKYYFREKLSLGILFYVGKMHREGSDSKPYLDGLVKWPENDTNYLGGILNISWLF
jgi:hypothetical protein